jgi:hypothetical protein
MASSSCQGNADAWICDASQLITAAAALCIAHASGLANGLDSPSAQLIYNYGYRRMIWYVQNVLDRSGPSERGAAYDIDAVTGQVLGKAMWFSTPWWFCRPEQSGKPANFLSNTEWKSASQHGAAQQEVATDDAAQHRLDVR